MPNYVTHILDEDKTAADAWNRVYKKYIEDVENGVKTSSYIIREFAKDKSVDINGAELPTPKYAIDKAVFAEVRKMLKRVQDETNESRKAVRASDARAHLRRQYGYLEKSIGLPNLPSKPDGVPKTVKLRSFDEIKERFFKYQRREAFEVKHLRAMCGEINRTLNPETKVGLSTLKWLMNNGEGRTAEEIVSALYNAIAERERDKLFYIRRHPKQRNLHKCHDEGKLEEISILRWAINDKPFSKIRKYGNSVSRFV